MISQLNDLLSDDTDDRLMVFNQGGHLVHTKFLRSSVQTNRLVVSFHGAVSQNTGTSIFDKTRNSKALNKYAHQISILDPTVICNETISIGWYLGDHGYPAQRILSEFIHQVTEMLQVERIVFVGSSGGGFASLYFSFYHPGSISLPIVPQTRLRLYSSPSGKRGFLRYCNECWPGLSEDEVSERVCVDVTELYSSEPFRNAVVLLMSPGDVRHFSHHATPFLSRVYDSLSLECINLSLISDYGGVPGHSGAVRGSMFLPWIKAALAAPSIAQQDILESYHTINSQLMDEASKKRAQSSSIMETEFALQEIEFAEVLRRYQIGALSGEHA